MIPSPPLGIVAKFVSPPPNPKEQEAIIRRFQLQSSARKLLPSKHRTRFCCRFGIPGTDGAEIWRSAETGRCSYRNLQVCANSAVCPVCAAKITERRRVELGEAVANWRLMEGEIAFVTYTVRHHLGDNLAGLLDDLNRARRVMQNGAPWQRIRARHGIEGYVRGEEVTWGVNGWHPHFHELMFVPAGYDNEALQADLRRRWAAAVVAVGLPPVEQEIAVVVEHAGEKIAEYIEKFGREPRWREEHEVAKSPVKVGRLKGLAPLQLLSSYAYDKNAQHGALWAEYARAMEGRSPLRFSPGMKKRLGLCEKTDKELAAERQGAAEHFGTLAWSTYGIVRRAGHGIADQRGQVLAVASFGDWDRVLEYVGKLRELLPASLYRRVAAKTFARSRLKRPCTLNEEMAAELGLSVSQFVAWVRGGVDAIASEPSPEPSTSGRVEGPGAARRKEVKQQCAGEEPELQCLPLFK